MWLFAAVPAIVAALYLCHINHAMKAVPDEAAKLSPHRWTIEEIKEAYKKSLESPIDVTKSLPPKQSRRYVIVGGTGASIYIPRLSNINHANPDL
jgi:hypothetical protein